ncbi:hypothetical protein Tco_0155944 [Tanacetum coccineum]
MHQFQKEEQWMAQTQTQLQVEMTVADISKSPGLHECIHPLGWSYLEFTPGTTGKGLLQAVPSGPSLGDCVVWKGVTAAALPAPLIQESLISAHFLGMYTGVSGSGRRAETSFSSSPALKGKGYLSTKLSEAMDFTDWCQSECVSGLWEQKVLQNLD